ncbi:PTS system mannose/fructose/sorbose family transporter subunit IID [Zophobihabitans entericus]|uniref:PTS system mannose/fructose/sorbose family transporter subunit IID n=1 Tax=Zophobihabitans entericus TaxID=1635327 RepID=A0A6G9IDA2_9GAMM|nr:PTS system mannose/fructose/sorbose family transporter subunit IID [Zophobihabitans entericus]QIQ22203.1 PTS system mannose/fructose/sorbose family transporter subunit IID [Zophobihabitans entericus]
MTDIQQRSIDLKPEEITKKDVMVAWLRFYYANEIPHSFDRYIAAALLWGLMPILKKLYKDKDDLIAAYQRHLLFFNTQLTWGGGTITGIVSSLEIVRAQETYEGKPISINDDLLYNTKAGLMGALAGIGDAIDSGTVQYIFIAIALPWAQQGLAIGALFPFIAFVTYQVSVGYYFCQLGFKLGRNAATEVVGTKMQMIIEALSILGLFMMGILAASYIKVASSLRFNLSGKDFVIQETLDKILPGLLPLVVVSGLYFYFTKKGLKVTNALIGLTIILGVWAAIEYSIVHFL